MMLTEFQVPYTGIVPDIVMIGKTKSNDDSVVKSPIHARSINSNKKNETTKKKQTKLAIRKIQDAVVPNNASKQTRGLSPRG